MTKHRKNSTSRRTISSLPGFRAEAVCRHKPRREMLAPFLRWAGGKRRFASSILEHFPSHRVIKEYYEPFLGAGALFLAYRPRHARLSDLNPALVATYIAIKDRYQLVHRYVQELVSQDSEDFYYHVREQYNRGSQRFLQAARFIYLNQTCFNGIFRVNTQGQFNVPYGFKEKVKTPLLDQLKAISRLLRHVQIRKCSFRRAVQSAGDKDLVYLDPPYPPINGTSYFTHYTKERFSDDDQTQVASVACELDSRGCFVVITNADTPLIRSLYRGWNLFKIDRPRWITSSKRKHRVGELIITNYAIFSKGGAQK
jgi:DNA adenine methylase